MVRFGLEDDDPFIFLQTRPNNGYRVFMEYRATKGGLRQTTGGVYDLTSPPWLRFKKSGDNWAGEYSISGNTFLPVATVNVTSPASFHVMRATCSTSDGNPVTAVYSNDSFWTGNRVSKSIVNAGSGTWTVVAVDNEGNESAPSAGVSAAISSTGVFPGTNLKFYPGFVMAGSPNDTAAYLESRYEEFFAGSRKETYRPPGIYAGIIRAGHWRQYYTNAAVKPTDTTDHTDPGYDWSKLDAVFSLNCVQNEGVMVVITIGEIAFGGGHKMPAWLINAPYNGEFVSGLDGGSEVNKNTPKYYRYSGPDAQGRTDVGVSPPIVDEFVNFHRAMYEHVVATGNIDKVMFVGTDEFFVSNNPQLPADYNKNDFYHGVGTRLGLVASIWAESNIMVSAISVVAESKDYLWSYMDSPTVGMGFPDMKLSSTGGVVNGIDVRFRDDNGVYQKDNRLLFESTQSHGQRENTYFTPGVQNPWGYSGVWVPQTVSHILWVLSGSPTAINKDSGLGQVGDDPAGLMPVHTVVCDWGQSWQRNSPPLSEWHDAIDTFGPPGTKAFPYLPPGYSV